MKIKKVDDKPMIIHTKEKSKIHMHENQDAKIKGNNVYMADYSPKCKDSTTKQTELVNQGKKSSRKRTIHQNRLSNLNPVSQYRNKRKDSSRSVKVKNSTIRNAGFVSASITVNQLEGGEEIQNSAMIASTITRPAAGIASKGASLFRNKIFEEGKAKIKKVEAGKKLGQKKIRDTAAGSARKFAKNSAKKVSKNSAKLVAKETVKVGAKLAGMAAGTAATEV